MAEHEMRERPVIFSAPMVRAILDGRKTQTRRVVKTQPEMAQLLTHSGWNAWHDERGRPLRNPYGQPGVRLWVRETWAEVHPLQVAEGRYSQGGRAGIPGPPPVDYRTIYRADGEFPPIYCLGGEPWPYRSLEPFERDGIQAFVDEPIWTPSIHMPRWASRILLEITDVRVGRLQEISEDDALAEGIRPFGDGNGFHVEDGAFYSSTAASAFAALWESINGPGSWEANPWVWAITFRRIEA